MTLAFILYFIVVIIIFIFLHNDYSTNDWGQVT